MTTHTPKPEENETFTNKDRNQRQIQPAAQAETLGSSGSNSASHNRSNSASSSRNNHSLSESKALESTKNKDGTTPAKITFAKEIEVHGFEAAKRLSCDWGEDTERELPEKAAVSEDLKMQRREGNRLERSRSALLKAKRQEYIGSENFAAWRSRKSAANKKNKKEAREPWPPKRI